MYKLSNNHLIFIGFWELPNKSQYLEDKLVNSFMNFMFRIAHWIINYWFIGLMVLVFLFSALKPKMYVEALVVNSYNIEISDRSMVGRDVTINGTASGNPFVGQLDQYNVQINWGDGSALDVTSTINFVETSPNAFSITIIV